MININKIIFKHLYYNKLILLIVVIFLNVFNGVLFSQVNTELLHGYAQVGNEVWFAFDDRNTIERFDLNSKEWQIPLEVEGTPTAILQGDNCAYIGILAEDRSMKVHRYLSADEAVDAEWIRAETPGYNYTIRDMLVVEDNLFVSLSNNGIYLLDISNLELKSSRESIACSGSQYDASQSLILGTKGSYFYKISVSSGNGFGTIETFFHGGISDEEEGWFIADENMYLNDEGSLLNVDENETYSTLAVDVNDALFFSDGRILTAGDLGLYLHEPDLINSQYLLSEYPVVAILESNIEGQYIAIVTNDEEDTGLAYFDFTLSDFEENSYPQFVDDETAKEIIPNEALMLGDILYWYREGTPYIFRFDANNWIELPTLLLRGEIDQILTDETRDCLYIAYEGGKVTEMSFSGDSVEEDTLIHIPLTLRSMSIHPYGLLLSNKESGLYVSNGSPYFFYDIETQDVFTGRMRFNSYWYWIDPLDSFVGDELMSWDSVNNEPIDYQYYLGANNIIAVSNDTRIITGDHWGSRVVDLESNTVLKQLSYIKALAWEGDRLYINRRNTNKSIKLPFEILDDQYEVIKQSEYTGSADWFFKLPDGLLSLYCDSGLDADNNSVNRMGIQLRSSETFEIIKGWNTGVLPEHLGLDVDVIIEGYSMEEAVGTISGLDMPIPEGVTLSTSGYGYSIDDDQLYITTEKFENSYLVEVILSYAGVSYTDKCYLRFNIERAEEPPYWSTFKPIPLSTQSAVSGTPIGCLDAYDHKSGENLEYQIINEEGAHFTINDSYLILSEDIQVEGSVSVTVRATDEVGLYSDITIDLYVKEVSESKTGYINIPISSLMASGEWTKESPFSYEGLLLYWEDTAPELISPENVPSDWPATSSSYLACNDYYQGDFRTGSLVITSESDLLFSVIGMTSAELLDEYTSKIWITNQLQSNYFYTRNEHEITDNFEMNMIESSVTASSHSSLSMANLALQDISLYVFPPENPKPFLYVESDDEVFAYMNHETTTPELDGSAAINMYSYRRGLTQEEADEDITILISYYGAAVMGDDYGILDRLVTLSAGNTETLSFELLDGLNEPTWITYIVEPSESIISMGEIDKTIVLYPSIAHFSLAKNSDLKAKIESMGYSPSMYFILDQYNTIPELKWERFGSFGNGTYLSLVIDPLQRYESLKIEYSNDLVSWIETGSQFYEANQRDENNELTGMLTRTYFVSEGNTPVFVRISNPKYID